MISPVLVLKLHTWLQVMGIVFLCSLGTKSLTQILKVATTIFWLQYLNF